jgi:hypothetical protein
VRLGVVDSFFDGARLECNDAFGSDLHCLAGLMVSAWARSFGTSLKVAEVRKANIFPDKHTLHRDTKHAIR